MNMQIHIYKFICRLLWTHVYIHNHTYTYQVGIQHGLLFMWGFSLLVLQNSGKVFKLKGNFYFKHTML